MPEVNIYIDVSFLGPLKCGTGTYNIMLEIIKKDGTPGTKEHYEGFNNTTKNRTSLKACISALDYITKPSKAKLIINNRYIVQAAEEKLYESWLKYQVNAKNEQAKNLDLWQQLAERLIKHEVTFAYEIANTYSTYMYFAAKKVNKQFEDDCLVK